MSERPLKVLLVGDGTVGKTSLCTVFTKKSFPSKYVPTVMEVAFSSIKIQDVTHRLTIWDTAGQEDFDRLRLLSYPNTDVFVVCYAVDNNHSFNSVSSKWIPELNKHCPHVPFILVSTKMDKRQDGREKQRDLISRCSGQQLANDIRAAHFVECSALIETNVSVVFKKATEAALRLNKKPCVIL